MGSRESYCFGLLFRLVVDGPTVPTLKSTPLRELLVHCDGYVELDGVLLRIAPLGCST